MISRGKIMQNQNHNSIGASGFMTNQVLPLGHNLILADRTRRPDLSLIHKILTYLCKYLISLFLLMFFFTAELDIRYTIPTTYDMRIYSFSGCKGRMRFFRFIPDASAAVKQNNIIKTTARDHEKCGPRRCSFSDIPTIRFQDLKIIQSNERGQSCQEIGRSGAEKNVKKNADMSVSRSIADGATRSVSATKKKSAKNVKRKSNKKKGGNNGSGVRSRVHLSAVSDRVNSRKLINHTRGSK